MTIMLSICRYYFKYWRYSNGVISPQLWDVAGHERFGTMTRVYYKYAIAAVIVFDVQRPVTFDAVLKVKIICGLDMMMIVL